MMQQILDLLTLSMIWCIWSLCCGWLC